MWSRVKMLIASQIAEKKPPKKITRPQISILDFFFFKSRNVDLQSSSLTIKLQLNHSLLLTKITQGL